MTQEGDTLPKIAAATGIALERLQELNPGVNAAALLDPGKPIRTH
jgi:LysM repeat protein